jgi:urease accessory protein
MIELTQIADPASPVDDTLTLPFELRQKSRLRATLDSGREAGVFLPRGTRLRDGDVLAAGDFRVRVRAALECVSTVHCDDDLALARACYHLGNRHVPVEIAQGRARYLHDHVLDDMLRGLGMIAVVESAPFEPEPGAYGDHGHLLVRGPGPHHHGHGHLHHHEPDDGNIRALAPVRLDR